MSASPSRDKGPPSSSASSGAARSASSSSSTPSRNEDLGKTWRSMANCLIMAAQKADKLASTLDASSSSTTNNIPMDRETDDYIVNYLKIRINCGKMLTYLEAELEGKAQEMQSLQHYQRTMPKCSRPKKRARLNEDKANAKGTQAESVAAAESLPLTPTTTDPTATAETPPGT